MIVVLRLFFFINIVLICSCSNKDLPPEYNIAFEIIQKTRKSFKEKYDLNLIGIGYSGNESVFSTLRIDFTSTFAFDKHESRELIFKCVDEFLQKINESEELRPFLVQYPFSYENVEMAIFFFANKDFKQSVPYPNICVITLTDGMVRFCTEDESDPYVYKSVEKESYKESLLILNGR